MENVKWRIFLFPQPKILMALFKSSLVKKPICHYPVQHVSIFDMVAIFQNGNNFSKGLLPDMIIAGCLSFSDPRRNRLNSNMFMGSFFKVKKLTPPPPHISYCKYFLSLILHAYAYMLMLMLMLMHIDRKMPQFTFL